MVNRCVQRGGRPGSFAHPVYRPRQPLEFQRPPPLQVHKQRSLSAASEYVAERGACLRLDVAGQRDFESMRHAQRFLQGGLQQPGHRRVARHRIEAAAGRRVYGAGARHHQEFPPQHGFHIVVNFGRDAG